MTSYLGGCLGGTGGAPEGGAPGAGGPEGGAPTEGAYGGGGWRGGLEGRKSSHKPEAKGVSFL